MKMQILITTRINPGKSPVKVIDEKNLNTRLNEDLMEVEAQHKGNWHTVQSEWLVRFIVIND
jgi:hypothetical protein